MLRESGQPGSRRVRWGSVSVYRDAIKDHLRRILDVVDSRTIRRRQLGIVLDCVHGAGGLLLVPLLEKLGCRVAVLHGEPTGLFPRDPEPRRENLEELCRRVKRDKADLGLAVDPDGDRLATVSERGEPLGEEMTLVLAAMEVLRAESGTVVTNLSTTRALEDVARGCGGRVVRTKVGEANVVSGMRRHRAVLGGEGNGGVIDPRVHYGRDAGVACGLILSLLARSGQRASQAARAAPRYFMRKSKIRVDRSAGLQQKLRCWRGGGVTDLRDGLRVDWDDGWIHLRPSGTEPVLRVIAEATSEARLNELHRMAIELVRCGRRE
jgi:phosphomannomutase